MLRRRWYLVIFPAIAGLVLGYGALRVLPKRYTSRSLMLVERQQVPNSFVEPVITEDVNARIANIEEQVLSRTRLEPIIERYAIFKGQSRASMDALVLRLQRSVTLTPVKPVVRTQDETIPGFYLAVTLHDPRIAQQVCADIASMFIDEDIRERQLSAEGTTSFLQSQLDDAKRKLDDQDAILANFERKYMGVLPDEAKTNLSMLGTLNTQLQVVTETLNRAIQDKAYMQSVLAQQLQAWKLTSEMKAGYIPSEQPNPTYAQLAKLEAQLATLEARYTDEYPDIIKVKSEIRELKKQVQGSAVPLDSKKAATTASALEPSPIQKLRSQLRGLDETIKINTHEQQELRNNIKAYEARLQLSPGVNEEYKKITRDHDMALKFYNDLLAKRDESEMASDLQRRQEGEQLRVMDPANLPAQPSFPKPPQLLGGGLAGGLVLGLAGILAVERQDKRIRSVRDVEFYLRASPFALIPSIKVTQARHHARLKREKDPRKLVRA
ncbi:MAG: GumC family protein [Terriglobia bacterium]